MTTEFKIFNVRHGFCAALMADNHLTLIDCGHDNNYKHTPLEWLYFKGYRHIDSLIISNFDQDHISDIKTVRDKFTVGKLVVNPYINANQLRNIKINGGSITEQMEIVLANIDRPELKAFSESEISTPEAQFNFFSIIYPYETDTNNLSLVSFIRFGHSKIIYPGDVEKRGWEKFLQNPEFMRHLGQVNTFIASHHGRENGYCKEIFDSCSPEVVIVSDQERKYETQNHDLYSKHASGINFGTLLTPKVRKVLTTRNDGDLTVFNQNLGTFIKLGS